MQIMAVVLIVVAVLVIALVIKLVLFGAGAIIRGIIWLVQSLLIGIGRAVVWLVFGVRRLYWRLRR
jgi:hypothetical protein